MTIQTIISIDPTVTLRALIQDDIAAFGYQAAAKLRGKKIPFSLYYWLAFGKAPRKLQASIKA